MSTRRGAPLGLIALLLLGGGAVAYFGFGVGRPRDDSEAPALHVVTKGPLRVTVLESGSLEALASTTIASQVEGQAAIQFIVPEGTVLTAQDVAQKREIVRLDPSDIIAKLKKQSIDVASARASTVNAEKGLLIQQQEDASKERQALLQVEFARLDLRRSVGVALAERLEAHRRRLDAARAAVVAAAAKDAAPASAEPPNGAHGQVATLQAEQDALIQEFLEDAALAGETLQKQRQLRSDISLADEELKRAQVKWDWSKKLLEKDFVSRDEEDADRLAFERRKIEKERAETAYTQFATYDYPKSTLKLLSDLVEAEGELSRVRERAKAAQNRAEAEVRASRQRQTLQEELEAQYTTQLAACSIVATVPGLVLYASSTGERGWNDDQRIKEGATIKQRQPIIVIPDTDQMGVRLNIHESVVEKVRAGLPATVTVDAAPDRPLQGKVESVKDVPNATDRWMNPDLKVYTTMIRLAPAAVPLRPGMSAKAEILVEELADVVSVPVQAVGGPMGRPTVWVWDGTRALERPVTLGSTNDRFVQVTSGDIAPGERVLLAPPRSERAGEPAKEKVPTAGPKPADKLPATLPATLPEGPAAPAAPSEPAPGTPDPGRGGGGKGRGERRQR